ncbi:MAG: hypothetical protein K8U57_17250 [Planctomycetes bacterium]|nr:hypothetical protein [Planctomycetota bacterium]
MTEAAWLVCADPELMLDALQPAAGDRKLRLFGIACCRLSWDAFLDVRLRNAVEFAEKHADGRLDEMARAAVKRTLLDMYERELEEDKEFTPTLIPRILKLISHQRYDSVEAICCSASVAHWALGDDYDTNYRPFEAELVAEHTQLLRDIFGPRAFRRILVEHTWLTSTVQLLAAGTYEERAFDRMPILGDALQDAGCDNDDILNHCRQPGEHVRGCWVVDLILGKK